MDTLQVSNRQGVTISYQGVARLEVGFVCNAAKQVFEANPCFGKTVFLGTDCANGQEASPLYWGSVRCS